MLLVFGLDGGTLNLAGRWLDEGKLPNLARLCRRARWGELHTVVPPATMPNWTTFMTGVNPGRHGIFDFTQRVPGTYGVRFINSTFRRTPTVWRLLSDAGKRVAVLGMPGTYPPEPLNGCMISGFDSPVTTRANRSFIFPPELADEIMALGGFSFADFQEFHVGPGWYRKALDQLLAGLKAKVRLARHLLRREPWDCFAIVFGESDTVAHHFWHFCDAQSPRHDPEAAAGALGTAIEQVYRAVDRAIGELMAWAAATPAVVVASDHAFGGASARAVYLNRWLAQAGWLRFLPHKPGGAAALAKRALLRAVPARWQAPLFRSFKGRVAERIEASARFGGIDWEHTRAYSEELNYFPSIWINRAGREPRGQVATGDYEKARALLVEALRQWRDAETGEPVVRQAWRREELYSGPWTELAPDVVLELAEERGYSYCCLGSDGGSGAPLRHLQPTELRGGKRYGMSGTHRAEGFYLVATPGDTENPRRAARMEDMAPTMLALCGVAAPAWMEGASAAGNPTGATIEPGEDAGKEKQQYGAADERALENRLRALGYIA